MIDAVINQSLFRHLSDDIAVFFVCKVVHESKNLLTAFSLGQFLICQQLGRKLFLYGICDIVCDNFHSELVARDSVLDNDAFMDMVIGHAAPYLILTCTLCEFLRL